MHMANDVDLVVVGAGILGMAGAYHILQENRGLDLLVMDRLAGAGQATTARSAAAYRDMFATPVNRRLSQGSISFYEKLQESDVQLDLLRIGYLWLLTAHQVSQYAAVLESIAHAGVGFETLEPQELTGRLPALNVRDIFRGILGTRCGILNPHRLSRHYEQEVARLGGRFQFGTEVTGFIQDHQGLIRGVRAGDQEIRAAQVIIATGPWMAATLGLAGLAVLVAQDTKNTKKSPRQCL
jgi:glycine/D-amino acid oxidase-like deaminating enzyme